MMTTLETTDTFTSREFNQNVSKAQRQAEESPVFITKRGATAYVLLNFEEYKRLKGGKTLAEALSHPDSADIDFEIPRLDLSLREADLD